MENAVSYLFFAFAAMLLLYAGALFAGGNPNMIPRHWAAEIKNTKQYARAVALVIALVACSPALAGLAGLLAGPGIALIVLLVTMVLFIWLGVRLVRKWLD